jgi:homoserine kinase
VRDHLPHPPVEVRPRLSPGLAVTIEVPATSANLGPGFDCFGLALDWRETVRLEVIETGFQLEVSGEGANQVPKDESHLIIRSTLVGLADLGFSVSGLRLTCRNTIPHGRGLGSSSAAIVAGLLAAQSLTNAVAATRVDTSRETEIVESDRNWLFGHAHAIEGHPDNVAAAIFGGFVMAYDGPKGICAAKGLVADGLSAVLFVADTPVATHSARGLLPAKVPHSDAAANSGRAALLVHAIASEPARLVDATRDWLHQDYRQVAMPKSYELLKKLRGQGFAAVISGAGPTVLVLGMDADLAPLLTQSNDGFRAIAARIGSGARLVATTG